MSIKQLWCDKYRPERFDQFQFHQNEAARLKKLISRENFPHLFIYGPCGSGKRTIVRSLLFEIFGSSSRKLKIETKIFETPSGKKIIQTFLSSNLHLEVNPSENGYYDRVVVQELIKNMATNLSVIKKYPFRMIIIDQADSLTKEAQQALRRTMEKYAETCRIILMAEHSSRIIPALKSRCLMFRCSSPSTDELFQVLQTITKAEQFDCNETLINNVIRDSDHNVRRAIILLQTIAIQQELNPQQQRKNNIQQLEQFRWQQKLTELSKKLTHTQNVKQVSEIRQILFDLQTHLIPSNIILRTLVCKLMDYCLDDEMKSNLISIAAEIDHRLVLGSKSIIHLELFCVKFMMMFRCTVEKVAFDLEQPMEFD
ncbi:replication factor C subunit RfC38 [Dermatophagoides pteronyssinus]|uniref:Replication factor C subunit 3-like n=2 Tax=Dermatophagoides pteronyssinus TaxID=6956 RepID=A0A6P6Y8M8_DERPT|nr:replication factor C subunit 3-like [Dermatophagoides pteronyssinus]KAH9423656.1 Subunit of heteropentameric Replication factor C (RF-C) [Dermatophagoides pteronyssinus]